MSKKDFLAEEERQKKKYMLATKDGKVEISLENVARVFAMMSNSPQYKKAENKDDEGSSAYWFAKWKKNKTISEDNLSSLLKCLNKENRTRVSKDGLEQIRDNILAVPDIKKALGDPEHKVVETIIKIPSTITSRSKIHFSFATKFCHYACMYLLDGEARDNFPIFDDIMRQNLGKYSEKWDKAKIDGKPRRNATYKDLAKTEDGLVDFYGFYVKSIEEVAQENGVSKTGVEQLIWYYHNGG